MKHLIFCKMSCRTPITICMNSRHFMPANIQKKLHMQKKRDLDANYLAAPAGSSCGLSAGFGSAARGRRPREADRSPTKEPQVLADACGRKIGAKRPTATRPPATSHSERSEQEQRPADPTNANPPPPRGEGDEARPKAAATRGKGDGGPCLCVAFVRGKSAPAAASNASPLLPLWCVAVCAGEKRRNGEARQQRGCFT